MCHIRQGLDKLVAHMGLYPYSIFPMGFHTYGINKASPVPMCVMCRQDAAHIWVNTHFLSFSRTTPRFLLIKLVIFTHVCHGLTRRWYTGVKTPICYHSLPSFFAMLRMRGQDFRQ